MNPFKPQNGPIDRPKRNVYDLSYTSHLTANLGTLYPVFCKKVSPGDSMSIETTFGLRAQPMIFPVQTKMRADIHYFYVRNRTLWNNFMDFYGKTKEGLVHPYIDRPVSEFRTGSIYDYMGVPTTIMSGSYFADTVGVNPYDPFHTRYKELGTFELFKQNVLSGSNSSANRLQKVFGEASSYNYTNYFYVLNYSYIPDYPYLGNGISNTNSSKYSTPGTMTGFFNFERNVFTLGKLPSEIVLGFPNSNLPVNDVIGTNIGLRVYTYNEDTSHKFDSMNFSRDAYSNIVLLHAFSASDNIQLDVNNDGMLVLSISPAYTAQIYEMLNTLCGNLGVTNINYCFVFTWSAGTLMDIAIDNLSGDTPSSQFQNFGNYILYQRYTDEILDSSELETLPWTGGSKQLKINALPYRGYEAIYNSFYRNSQVTPFKINGIPEYNKYVSNLGDGADSFPYRLYQRNFEYDFLTGAFHAPQQGEAPLIGISVNNKNQTAEFKFSSSQINNGAVITATTSINEEGDVIGITGYDPDLPQSNIDKLMTAINYGISINDIRQTNALQKWLEKNIRRGYKYKDQLMSHFGVKVEYKELLMPEFIGGVSQDIKTDTIYQMATNENGYLGDYAGRAGVVGGSNHRVSKFCDEAGFIIGIMSIVPTPVYSQVPAGYAFDNNLFDYFFPEFSKIGMQPIFNYQVTPLQSQDNLDGVFGYQRPYWDLIRSIDEVHGEFRTTANGYVIQRHFADTPELNQHFTEISNDALSDVFMITNEDVSNQFLGMIHFNCKRKTAIPMYGIPSIE